RGGRVGAGRRGGPGAGAVRGGGAGHRRADHPGSDRGGRGRPHSGGPHRQPGPAGTRGVRCHSGRAAGARHVQRVPPPVGDLSGGPAADPAAGGGASARGEARLDAPDHSTGRHAGSPGRPADRDPRDRLRGDHVHRPGRDPVADDRPGRGLVHARRGSVRAGGRPVHGDDGPAPSGRLAGAARPAAGPHHRVAAARQGRRPHGLHAELAGRRAGLPPDAAARAGRPARPPGRPGGGPPGRPRPPPPPPGPDGRPVRRGVLEVARPAATARRIRVVYYEGWDGRGQTATGITWDSAVLTLLCEDPYWEDVQAQTVHRESGTQVDYLVPYPSVSSSQVLGATTVTNPGDVDVWPVWTVTGPASAITFTRDDTEESFTLDMTATAHGPLLEGETVTISTDPPRVRASSGENLVSGLNWPEAVLWSIPPGQTPVTFALAGAETGSAVDLAFHPRYETA